jgi:hypothetical protein
VEAEGEEAVVGAEAVSALYAAQIKAASELAATQRRFAEGKLAAASNWPLAEAGEGAKLREKTVSFATAQAEAARKEVRHHHCPPAPMDRRADAHTLSTTPLPVPLSWGRTP